MQISLNLIQLIYSICIPGSAIALYW